MYQLFGHCSGVMDQILPKGPKVIFSRCSKIQFAFSEWLRLVKNQSPGSLRQYLTTNVLWGEFQRITAVQTVNHGLFWITSFPACQCPHRTDHLPPFSNWKELFLMKIWTWHVVEIQIWTWGTFSDLRNGFLGLWAKQGWHRPLPSKRIIVRFYI